MSCLTRSSFPVGNIPLCLQQRYWVTRVLGRGGLGEVYLAEDLAQNCRLVAVKRPLVELPERGGDFAWETFQNEIAILSGLSHPAIPALYDYVQEAGHHFMVREYIEGQTLAQHIQHTPRRQLPVKEVLRIGGQLCEVLGYLHQRPFPILFRDLKPANIMVSPEDRVGLIDFGLAKPLIPGYALDVSGTPAYAAPEQLHPERVPNTPRADIYTLGVVLHEMLSGEDPAKNQGTFSSLVGRFFIPIPLALLIQRMLKERPEERPGSALLVKQEFLRIADRLAEQTQPADAGVTALHDDQARVRVLRPVQQRVSGEHLEKKVPVCPSRGQTCAALWWGSHVRVALGAADGAVQICDARGRRLAAYHGHEAGIVSLAWTPDVKWIASGAQDGMIHIWLSTSGKRQNWHRMKVGSASALAWDPKGKFLAVGTAGQIEVWDPWEGYRCAVYAGPKRGVAALAWSPDGHWVAAAGRDASMEVIQVQTRLHIFSSGNGKDPVSALVWTADGEYLVCGNTRSPVQLWHPFTGSYVGKAAVERFPVQALACSPNGRELVALHPEGLSTSDLYEVCGSVYLRGLTKCKSYLP